MDFPLHRIVRILEEANLVHLWFAALFFAFLGKKASLSWPRHDAAAKFWGALSMFVFLGRWLWLDRLRPDDLIEVTLRAVAILLLSFGAAALLLPMLAKVADLTLGKAWRAMKRVTNWLHRGSMALQHRPFRRTTRPTIQAVAAADVAAVNRIHEEQIAQSLAAQRRRDDARAACELLFHLHAHSIGERFPKTVFDDFTKRYMGDGQTPEYVEERGRQLTELIQKHARRVSSSVEAQSLPTALAKFQEKLEQVRQSELDDEWKDSLIAQLQDGFYEQLQSTLEQDT